MNESSPARRLRTLWTTAGLVAVLTLVACASTPPAPTANLVAARSAIADAEKAGAGQYASQELTEARAKLAAAENAVGEKNMAVADRLALQSRVEANLASARTGAAKAAVVNDEMKRSNDALVEEMQRKTGDK
jgi:hypothetical protein